MQKTVSKYSTLFLALITLLLVVVINISNSLFSYARYPSIETKISDIYALSSFITKPAGYLSEGQYTSINKLKNQEASKLNTRKAMQAGYSPHSIKLMEELLLYNKEIQKAGLRSQNIVEGAKQVNLDNYSLVKKFFKEAKARKNEKINLSRHTSQNHLGGMKAFALQVFSEEEGMKVCGYFDNPKPDKTHKGKIWYYSTKEEAEQVARDWGYHPPLVEATKGWTRPVTWKGDVCGDGTFRDNAEPNYWYTDENGNSVQAIGEVVEQNYEGWEPRGEPNPEVYSSMQWPYTIWPSYVVWWHDKY